MELAIAMPSTKKRSINIREVDNGFILRCTVDNPTGSPATERYMEKELVMLSLPQLLKTVKTFFEPILVEESQKSGI